jgi:Cellulose binding domain
MRGPVGDGRGHAPRRRRRRPFTTLLSLQPDLDDLFLRPGEAVGRSREPAKHRARKRFRGISGNRFLVAVLAVVAVAACFGGLALAGSLKGGAPAPRHGALPQAPQPAIASASGFPPFTVSGSPPAPQSNQMGVAPAIATGARHAIPHASPIPTAASPTPTVAASPTATSGQPVVTVSYAVDEQVGDSFEAEIDVTNDGSSSISGWQILVALPHDQITELANATGYESNHILLLQPASSGSAIAPGATLRVYLDAQGTRTSPELCAFDNVICG